MGHIPVFYTKIRAAYGQTEIDVIRRAHVLGYELIPFSGYTNSDIGYAGNPGPLHAQSRENLRRAIAIQDACRVVIDGQCDWPHIQQS